MEIPFFPLPLILGLALLAASLISLRRKKRSLTWLLTYSIFWLYMLFLIGLTLFPLTLPLPGEPPLPLDLILTRVNLIPFSYVNFRHPDLSLTGNLVGNVLAAIPFGFLLPRLWPMPLRKFICFAFGLGTAIELSQLALGLLTGGTFFRFTDSTDVLLNAAGVLTGFGLQSLLARLDFSPLL